MIKMRIIALTLFYASTLQGMENQPSDWEMLPQDVQRIIIRNALATSNNVDEAIKAIKAMSALQGIKYDNLKNFTSLIGALSEKFPDMTRQELAEKFNTPTANKYMELGDDLSRELVGFSRSTGQNTDYLLPIIANIIKDGADSNYSSKSRKYPPLIAVIDRRTNNAIKLIEMLLDNGANPNIAAIDFWIKKNKAIQNKTFTKMVDPLLPKRIALLEDTRNKETNRSKKRKIGDL